LSVADEAALSGGVAALFEQALPRIYGYFFHRCGGSAATAEELTQETFLAATAAIRAGREAAIEAPLPWLFGIARHKLLDHYRREAHAAGTTLVSWEAWGDEEESAAADPDLGEAPWVDAGWRERTLRALAALPPAQRQALTLRHLDGLSVPEIAVAVGRSVHAVESLLARGRAGFKRAYTEASDG
jgi:RNA polymerase sigma-70 factor (ECF subfamily)